MKFRFFLPLMFVGALVGTVLAQQNVPRVFSVDPRTLLAAKERCASQDVILHSAFSRLLVEADQARKTVPVSVVEKNQAPPSGDKHDYMSLARYYWPDTTKPNGLPYVSRDGVPNPEIDDITDSKYFSLMCTSVWDLGLAYYFTSDERFAEHAARFLRVWFMDTTTIMNPNMRFAQGIKGRKESSFAGIIETRNMYQIVDAIGLIASSKAWTTDDQFGMTKWFEAYWKWLHEHPNGIEASRTPNNHGVWFDVQAVSIALFLGKNAEAAAIVEAAKTERVRKQIEPDGSMPKELRRTISNHYVQFNIEAFVLLADLGRSTGVDLWSYRTEDGRSIRAALEFLGPFIRKEREWTWKNIKPYDWSRMYPFFVRAAASLPDAGFDALADAVEDAESKRDIVNLLLGRRRPFTK